MCIITDTLLLQRIGEGLTGTVTEIGVLAEMANFK